MRIMLPGLDWVEAIAGLFTVAGAAVAFHFKARAARRERERDQRKEDFHDAFVLSLNNGAGKIVSGIVERAVIKAIQEHQIQCPMRPLVESMNGRVLTLERTP